MYAVIFISVSHVNEILEKIDKFWAVNFQTNRQSKEMIQMPKNKLKNATFRKQTENLSNVLMIF